MGLASVLFTMDDVSARLRGEAREPGVPVADRHPGGPSDLPVTRTAASEPAAHDDQGHGGPQVAEEQRTEDPGAADFVLLWPALGCPALVDPRELELELLFVSKREPSAVEGKKDYIGEILSKILVLEWDDAREPYRSDGKQWDAGSIARRTTLKALQKDGDNGVFFTSKPMDLGTYRSQIKDRSYRLGGLLHTMADVVPRAYRERGFKTIACVRIKLLAAADAGSFLLTEGKMYDLFYGPENGVMRSILDDSTIMDKPYDGIPLMSHPGNPRSPRIGGADLVYRWRHDSSEQPQTGRFGDRNREHKVRLFHPFCVVRENAGRHPNVGHVTDPHSSSLWDYFEERTFPNANFDTLPTVSGEDPSRPQKGGWIPERYNNPNLNTRNLTCALNSRDGPGYVDLILQTGDLIDFNRGFSLNPRHDPDKDYLLNLNWIRYYEILLMDYSRPTFTLLGNHERRLNPYPPRIKAEGVHTFLLLYLMAMMGGAGASFGSLFGLLQEEMPEDETGGRTTLQLLVIWLIVPIVFFLFLLLLAGSGLDFDIAADVLFSGVGLTILFAFGFIFGFVEFLFLLFLDLSRALPIPDAGTGALWGTVFGGGIGFIGSIVALCLMFTERDYMSHITNLRGDDLKSLLDGKNAAYLNAFGKDGLFYMTERSVDWYSLVINPFLDYSFQYRNTFILMGDWTGSEILTADPPVADDVFSERQWDLITRWGGWLAEYRSSRPLEENVVSILGLHTPVFCPEIDANLDDLHSKGSDVGSRTIARGTMEEHRKDLIGLLYKLVKGDKSDGKPIYVMSLTGHTHDYDVFRMESADRVFWDQFVDYGGATSLLTEKGLHITTTCAGPPSDGKIPRMDDAAARGKLLKVLDDAKVNGYPITDAAADFKKGERVARPSGCRVLLFDKDTGRLRGLEEISSSVARYGYRDE